MKELGKIEWDRILSCNFFKHYSEFSFLISGVVVFISLYLLILRAPEEYSCEGLGCVGWLRKKKKERKHSTATGVVRARVSR